MTQFVIRKATASDAKALSVLYSTLGYQTDLAYIRQQLDLHNNSETFVYVDDALKILGIIEFHLINTVYRKEPAGHISALIVGQKFQGQGIGSKLMEFIHDHAKSLGCGYLEVACNRKRTDAHLFYKKAHMSDESHTYFRCHY